MPIIKSPVSDYTGQTGNVTLLMVKDLLKMLIILRGLWNMDMKL